MSECLHDVSAINWGNESTCNWSLDVTYNEDGLKSRNRPVTENMAWLRRFILSMLKQHPGTMSLVMKRKSCGWNWNFLLQVLGVKGTECAVAAESQCVSVHVSDFVRGVHCRNAVLSGRRVKTKAVEHCDMCGC
jgi:hypothetical protein